MSEKKIKKKIDKKEIEKEEKREEIIEDINENLEKFEKSEEKKEPPKKQINTENKILFSFLAILILIVAVFAGYLIFSKSFTIFSVNGVQYEIVHQGALTLYDTKIPVMYQGKAAQYNIYLRNDPRQLEKDVPFNGSLYVLPEMVINITGNLNCNGDGTLAVANLQVLYKTVLGINFIADPNATCDPQARYVYLNIQESNETSIQEIAPACYNINVNNCNILPATERYMIETFSNLNYTKN